MLVGQQVLSSSQDGGTLCLAHTFSTHWRAFLLNIGVVLPLVLLRPPSGNSAWHLANWCGKKMKQQCTPQNWICQEKVHFKYIVFFCFFFFFGKVGKQAQRMYYSVLIPEEAYIWADCSAKRVGSSKDHTWLCFVLWCIDIFMTDVISILWYAIFCGNFMSYVSMRCIIFINKFVFSEYPYVFLYMIIQPYNR